MVMVDSRAARKARQKRRHKIEAYYIDVFTALLPPSINQYPSPKLEKVKRCLTWYGKAWEQDLFDEDVDHLQMAYSCMKSHISLKDMLECAHVSKEIEALCEGPSLEAVWRMIWQGNEWQFFLPFKSPVKFAIDNRDFQGETREFSLFKKILFIYQYDLALREQNPLTLKPLADKGFVPAKVDVLKMGIRECTAELENAKQGGQLSEGEEKAALDKLQHFAHCLEKLMEEYAGICPEIPLLLAEVYRAQLTFFLLGGERDAEKKMVEMHYRAYYYAEYLQTNGVKGYADGAYLEGVKQTMDKVHSPISKALIDEVKDSVFRSLPIANNHDLSANLRA